MAGRGDELIVVGRIAGAHGIRGDIKVYSYTEPPEEILDYGSWRLNRDGIWEAARVIGGHSHGKVVVARLDLCADRDTAQRLSGTDIAVRRDQLPPTQAGEYYWTDLIGLMVVNREGVTLGRVASLMETGAHDVLVLDDERRSLIPFVLDRVVLAVDLEQGLIRVDWDLEY